MPLELPLCFGLESVDENQWTLSKSCCRKFVTQAITWYLLNLMLSLSLKLVPLVISILSSIQGCISNSDLGDSAYKKVIPWNWNVTFYNCIFCLNFTL